MQQYILPHLTVQFTCVCCLCDMYEVNYPPWAGATSSFCNCYDFTGKEEMKRSKDNGEEALHTKRKKIQAEDLDSALV